MITADMQQVANSLVRRAQRQGWLLPSEIREELVHTRVPKGQWKRIIALSRECLRYRHGRYYFEPRAGARESAERQQDTIHHAVRGLIRQYRKEHDQQERRRRARIDFLQPVKVRADDDRELTLLSRDLSETGIRLISTQSFLGHKLWVELPPTQDGRVARFVVRILWTCSVGDGLFENGGTFLEMLEESKPSCKES
jgi:PilZ domain